MEQIADTGNNEKLNLTNAPDSNGKKRKSGGDNESDSKPRKRFVWPEALHKDFVAAVFDVGLKNASPKAIIELLPQTQALTSEHIKSHLQKFRVHRGRSREEFLSHYEQSVRSGRIPLGNLTSGMCISSTNPGGNILPKSTRPDDKSLALNVLRKQFDLITSTITVQAAFLDTLKGSITDQKRVKQDLAKRLVQLDPSLTKNSSVAAELEDTNNPSNDNLRTDNNPVLSIPTNLVGSAVAANNAALLMASEMQNLKQVHHVLNQRKESQMALFSSQHSNSTLNYTSTTSSTWPHDPPPPIYLQSTDQSMESTSTSTSMIRGRDQTQTRSNSLSFGSYSAVSVNGDNNNNNNNDNNNTILTNASYNNMNHEMASHGDTDTVDVDLFDFLWDGNNPHDGDGLMFNDYPGATSTSYHSSSTMDNLSNDNNDIHEATVSEAKEE